MSGRGGEEGRALLKGGGAPSTTSELWLAWAGQGRAGPPNLPIAPTWSVFNGSW